MSKKEIIKRATAQLAEGAMLGVILTFIGLLIYNVIVYGIS